MRPEAPAGAHGEVRKRVVSVMLGALAQIIPDRVSGDLCGTSFPNSIGGYSAARDRRYVYVEVPAGGNGGFEGHDGSSAFVNVDFGAIRSIHNVESLESEMPVFIERCELRADSGGEGLFRGGLGMHRALRLEEGEAVYSVLGDRAFVPTVRRRRSRAGGRGARRKGVRWTHGGVRHSRQGDRASHRRGRLCADGVCGGRRLRRPLESRSGSGTGGCRRRVRFGESRQRRLWGRARRYGRCRHRRDRRPARAARRVAFTSVDRRRRAAGVHRRQRDTPDRAPERRDGRTTGHRPRHPCRAARDAPRAASSVGENR